MQQTLALKCLTDFVLLYGSTVGLLLKRDLELTLPPRGGSNSSVPETTTSTATASAPHTAIKTPKTTSHHHHSGHHHHSKHKSAAGSGVEAVPEQGAAGKADAGAGAAQAVASPLAHRAGALLQRLLHFHLLSNDMLSLPGIGQSTGHLLQVGLCWTCTPSGSFTCRACKCKLCTLTG